MIDVKVAFVLRPVDDFSGKTILKKKFLFRVDGEPYMPIEKDEGLFVFLEPMNEQVTLEVEEGSYFTCTTVVNKHMLPPEEPIAEIRLYGRTGKGFPYPYDVVQGKLEEKKAVYPTQVCAIRKQETGLVFKELKKIENTVILVLGGFTRDNLLGKTYAMGHNGKLDVFILAEKTGINEYRIEGQIKEKHKAGTPLVRVYRSVTDNQGYYSIPVDVGEGEKISEVIALRSNNSS